ncbi:MAG: hypothetical protein IKS96_12640 [Fibrobacter sp.]|nr:hypothetical protein [Fibrobacter sp.]
MKRLSLVFLFITLATIVSSCNNSTSSFDVFALFSKSDCSVGMYQTMMQSQLDSLRPLCDTIYIRESTTYYKDTVYDDTVITNHTYTGFLYLNRYTGNTDTLVKRRADKSNESAKCGDVPVYCTLDSSNTQKTFSCNMSGLCYTILYDKSDIAEITKAKSVVAHYYRPSNVALCREPGYKCVVDTVYLDVFHTTFRKDTYDTSFLNYGKNAWTDYIPAVNAPPFDTAAFRKVLDTLDTREKIFGMDTLFTGYDITAKDLPDWAEAALGERCFIQDGVEKCTVILRTNKSAFMVYYPTSYSQKPFYLKNKLEQPLERDTVITWTLKYKYYDGSLRDDGDSLTIQTLFKGKNDYN